MSRFLFAVALLVITAGALRAQAPRSISIQGLLADAAGTVLGDGAHAITIRLYDAPNGGAPLFEESTTVAVERGVFSTTIGSTGEGIPASVTFDRAYFVGIAVDGGAEMLPRIAMTAVPYAFHAELATRSSRADTATRAEIAARAVTAGHADTSSHADHASVADQALSLAPAATGIVRSVNGRAGSLRIVGDGGITVSTSGDTMKLRALPVSHVQKTSVSAIELIDSAAFSSSGSGPMLRLDLRDTASTRIALRITSNSHGTSAIDASTTGGGSVAVFSKSKDRATGTGGTFIGPVLVAESRHGSQVTAAEFNALDTANTRPAVDIEHRGKGVGLQVDATGANIATFRRRRVTGQGSSSTSTVVRFDSTGKGFFDGGTQQGGADLAEAFDVAGERSTYTPGDVLVISTDRRRQVTRSTTPYSTLVAGVYATKPGVLLTEEANGTNIDHLVPMGVVGVIPTKVSAENGPIAIGDVLVTSSTPGHAMKADPTVAAAHPGSILGKALEAFDGDGAGVILVLVK